MLGAKVSCKTSSILVRSSSARFVGRPPSSRVLRASFGFHLRIRSPAGQCGRSSDGFNGRSCGLSFNVYAVRGEGGLSRASTKRGRLGCEFCLFIGAGVRLLPPVTLCGGCACLWFWRNTSSITSLVGSEGGVEVDDEVFDLVWEFDWGKEEKSRWVDSSRWTIGWVIGGVDVSGGENCVAVFQ